MAVQRRPGTSGFGTLLRQFRTTAGLSQEALAEQAGLSARTVSDLERGVKTRPHPSTLRLLADALGLDEHQRADLVAASRPGVPTTPARQIPNALPRPASPIIGRDREMATVIERLRSDTVRLLTVTGPGGVGKTRLSLEVARTLAPDYPDGVVYVELGPIDNASLTLSTVAAALHLRESGGQPLDARIRDHLRSRRMLLVLDNCEHVLDGVRPLASAILAAAPDTCLLATSRSPLHLQGEHLLPLAPLEIPDPDAHDSIERLGAAPVIDLFVQRAAAVRPSFRLTPENAGDIAEICRSLDGLPLAIELAAARIRSLSPNALLGLLSNRLRLLTAGPHDAPERHRTMRATIEWSHDLLAEEQQATFRRLAVFAGGCTLETATVVAGNGDPVDAIDAIEALVDQGLVLRKEDPDGDMRFAMLATVREFGLERLRASDELDAVHHRHAKATATMAARTVPHLEGPEPGEWLELLGRDQDNFRVALGWSLGERGDAELGLRLATTLWPYWHMRGDFQEAHEWLERTIAHGDVVDPTTRARAFLELANTANNLEDHDQAERLYTASLQLFEASEHRSGAASALVGLGMVATNRGHYDRAATSLQKALDLCRDVAEDSALVPGIYALGRLSASMGDYHAAETHFAEVAHLSGPDNAGVRAYLTLERAQIERYRGHFALATELAEACLARFREIGERRAEAATLSELGHLALARGDLDGAGTSFQDAVALHLELRDELGLVVCLEGFAMLAAARDRADLAAILGGAAQAWRDRTGSVRTIPEQRVVDERLASAREAGTSSSSALEAGSGMSLEQALSAARGLVSS